MWQETRHGLYKQFNFINFQEAFEFMKSVAQLSENKKHYPRLEIEWNVVKIWLFTNMDNSRITDLDQTMSEEINSLIKEGEPISKWKDNIDLQQEDHIKLYADGGSRGNPGPSASGFVMLDLADKIIYDKGVYLGITTNNQAEYTALKLGLAAALEKKVTVVDVFMDSLLVVNQMKGIFKIRNRDLWPIHAAIKELAQKFQKVTYTHIPRELNKLADAAVNRALDEALGITR